MYTLGEVHDHERGWGRAGETWRIKAELDAYDAQPAWFQLGDLDFATHLVRTRMLDAGYLAEPGDRRAVRTVAARRAPRPDDRRPVRDARASSNSTARAKRSTSRNGGSAIVPLFPPSASCRSALDDAEPAPGVLEAITGADAVLIAPSNPVVSIGTILGVPGDPRGRRRRAGTGGRAVADHRRRAAARHGRLVPAGDRCRGLGRRRRPALRRAQGRRPARRLADPRHRHRVACPACAVRAVPLLMTDDDATAAMVRAALELVRMSDHAAQPPRDPAGARHRRAASRRRPRRVDRRSTRRRSSTATSSS